jgi:hypothetical protein
MIARAKENGKDHDNAWLAGKVTLKAKSKFQPALAGVVGGKVLDFDSPTAIVANKDKFYAGVEALLQVNFVAYEGDPDADGNPKKGITTYLNMVMSTGKGAKLGGSRPKASSTFKGYVGTYSAEDPTGGVTEDEIPY